MKAHGIHHDRTTGQAGADRRALSARTALRPSLESTRNLATLSNRRWRALASCHGSPIVVEDRCRKAGAHRLLSESVCERGVSLRSGRLEALRAGEVFRSGRKGIPWKRPSSGVTGTGPSWCRPSSGVSGEGLSGESRLPEPPEQGLQGNGPILPITEPEMATPVLEVGLYPCISRSRHPDDGGHKMNFRLR